MYLLCEDTVQIRQHTESREEGLASRNGAGPVDVDGADEGLDDVGEELVRVEAGEERPGVGSTGAEGFCDIWFHGVETGNAALLSESDTGGGAVAHEVPDVLMVGGLDGGEEACCFVFDDLGEREGDGEGHAVVGEEVGVDESGSDGVHCWKGEKRAVVEDPGRDDEIEDGVAEEFEALIRRGGEGVNVGWVGEGFKEERLGGEVMVDEVFEVGEVGWKDIKRNWGYCIGKDLVALGERKPVDGWVEN